MFDPNNSVVLITTALVAAAAAALMVGVHIAAAFKLLKGEEPNHLRDCTLISIAYTGMTGVYTMHLVEAAHLMYEAQTLVNIV